MMATAAMCTLTRPNLRARGSSTGAGRRKPTVLRMANEIEITTPVSLGSAERFIFV
jgi:hypothetical protein